jgi:hypothetical protein
MAFHALTYDRLVGPPKARRCPDLLGLSDLMLPWVPLKNACAEDAEAACRERAIELGLLVTNRDLRRFDALAALAAHVYPTADADRLEACIDLCAWLWLQGDTADEDPASSFDAQRLHLFLEAHLDVLRTGRSAPGQGALGTFTLSLRNRILHLSRHRTAWLKRFTTSVEACLFERQVRASGEEPAAAPSLEQYLARRERSCALHACLDLVELAEGVLLPEEVHASAAIAKLRAITARVVALTDDLFAYEREVLRRGSRDNAVRILMEERRMSFEEAVDHVVRLVNADVRQFLEIERGLAPRRPLRAYIEGMKRWMRGNYDWSMKTGRYRSPDSPFPELRMAADLPSPRSRRAPHLQVVEARA